MTVVYNTNSQDQRPFKAELHGFGTCWDVVVSEIKIGHKVEFLHLKNKKSIYAKKKKKGTKPNTLTYLRPGEPLFLWGCWWGHLINEQSLILNMAYQAETPAPYEPPTRKLNVLLPALLQRNGSRLTSLPQLASPSCFAPSGKCRHFLQHRGGRLPGA